MAERISREEWLDRQRALGIDLDALGSVGIGAVACEIEDCPYDGCEGWVWGDVEPKRLAAQRHGSVST